MSTPQWLHIGTVGRTWGLKGDVFISGRDRPLPEDLRELYLGSSPSSARPLKIDSQWFRQGRPGLRFFGIRSPEAAQALTGQDLWLSRSDIRIDETSEYLWVDLIAKDVVDTAGAILGKVHSVYNYGASDIIELRATDGKRLAIPLVATYVDLSFSSKDSVIRLTVEAEVFAEAWEDA